MAKAKGPVKPSVPRNTTRKRGATGKTRPSVKGKEGRDKSARPRRVKAKPSAFNKKQLDLPAGFTVDGMRLASLREVLDPDIPTRALSDLSDHERIDLLVKRIELQPKDFKLAILGIGIIDNARLIAEVKARSRIGRHLLEIEHRVLEYLMEAVKQ